MNIVELKDKNIVSNFDWTIKMLGEGNIGHQKVDTITY
jgi:hypothetical protein